MTLPNFQVTGYST